ncbi:hypothetical protein P280DRAFT_98192 [Massarina eburnea CBS 473.64]|uniref:Uncharacterized protein n=1 Tax=Massarina eburnea CBS 473.64 TaxID=1395130 RepID=A0A6A6RUB5_9PLEO|nr:hypothetical protein P280DRAFT_98192 [Massarina eburnea CBS 473.64]
MRRLIARTGVYVRARLPMEELPFRSHSASRFTPHCRPPEQSCSPTIWQTKEIDWVASFQVDSRCRPCPVRRANNPTISTLSERIIASRRRNGDVAWFLFGFCNAVDYRKPFPFDRQSLLEPFF